MQATEKEEAVRCLYTRGARERERETEEKEDEKKKKKLPEALLVGPGNERRVFWRREVLKEAEETRRPGRCPRPDREYCANLGKSFYPLRRSQSRLRHLLLLFLVLQASLSVHSAPWKAHLRRTKKLLPSRCLLSCRFQSLPLSVFLFKTIGATKRKEASFLLFFSSTRRVSKNQKDRTIYLSISLSAPILLLLLLLLSWCPWPCVFSLYLLFLISAFVRFPRKLILPDCSPPPFYQSRGAPTRELFRLFSLPASAFLSFLESPVLFLRSSIQYEATKKGKISS